ncbi:hypothetical protein B0J14DRAFT_19649 [Halenospora varia]|nr:hypothetical protein B0J14DRAFT_19649 [Halenospora varia]
MDSPKMSDQTSAKELLSTRNGGEANSSKDIRSSSEAPSTTSTRSHVTIVDDRTDDPLLGGQKRLQRRYTQALQLKITRLDCLLGLFSPRLIEKRAERRAIIKFSQEEEEENEEPFDRKECPFIISVKVAQNGSKTYQETRCLLDTGCLKGNLISKDFAERLGFTSSDYMPLTQREKTGGVFGNGQTFVPVGALLLTWQNNYSIGIFRKMRFFVLDALDPQHELIIGARTIVDYNLLSALCMPIASNRGVTVISDASDKEEQALKSAVEDVEGKIETAENKLNKAKTDEDRKKLQAQIRKLKAELEIKRLELSIHKADKAVKKDPTENNKANLETLRNDLAELQKKSPKVEKKPKVKEAPTKSFPRKS